MSKDNVIFRHHMLARMAKTFEDVTFHRRPGESMLHVVKRNKEESENIAIFIVASKPGLEERCCELALYFELLDPQFMLSLVLNYLWEKDHSENEEDRR